MKQIKWLFLVVSFCIFALNISCTRTTTPSGSTQDGVPYGNVDVSKIPNAVPKNEARSAYGNPPTYVANGHRYYVLNDASGYNKRGIASWYGRKFQQRSTSSRERYNPWAMTAASPDLPIPTYVRVTNLNNGRQVIVKVNDRGPFAPNRIIDLSYAAAVKLGCSGSGTAAVQVTAIDPRHPNAVVAQNTGLRPGYRLTRGYKQQPQNQRQLFVQVGTYSYYRTAQRVRSSLTRVAGNTVNIVPVTHGRHTLYEVKVGPLKTLAQSNSLAQQLHRRGYSQSYTVWG